MRDLLLPVLAGAALGVGALCFPTALEAAEHLDPFHDRGCPGSTRDAAKTDTKTLVQVVDTWRLHHPELAVHQQCPTIAELKRDRALKVDQSTADPWGAQYIIFCPHDVDVVVMSAGPDGRYWTSDDIRAEGTP